MCYCQGSTRVLDLTLSVIHFHGCICTRAICKERRQRNAKNRTVEKNKRHNTLLKKEFWRSLFFRPSLQTSLMQIHPQNINISHRPKCDNIKWKKPVEISIPESVSYIMSSQKVHLKAVRPHKPARLSENTAHFSPMLLNI